MLDQQTRRVFPAAQSELQPPELQIGLREVLGLVRRRRTAIIGSVGAVLALACLYLLTTPPTYEATTSLLIDTTRLQVFGSEAMADSGAITNAAVETQLLVLTSGKVADAVVDRLGLMNDPNFMNPPQGLFDQVRGVVSQFVVNLLASLSPTPGGGTGVPADATERLRRRAATILARNLSVEREGLSYVINVSYSAPSPSESARLANAITAAYLGDQIAAQVEAGRQASTWLKGRIDDLEKQSRMPTLTPQERSAVRSTYDNLVALYTRMIQEESAPFTDARVITPAYPPPGKSTPRTTLILAGSLILGTMLGFGLALAREFFDRSIRSPQQLEILTGLPCLGVLQKFNTKGWIQRHTARRSKRENPPDGRRFAPDPEFAMVLSAPFSRFVETLRNVRLALETALPAGPVQVLGVTSSIPNEGRTTVAINLAVLAARSGTRVLLIDANLRNPLLSRSLVPDQTPGIVDAVYGEADLADLIWSDEGTSLKFLPVGTGTDRCDGSEVLSSSQMNTILDLLRPQYDLIIVDLPPVAPIVDVRAASSLFDGYVYVVARGATTQDIIVEALNNSGLRSKIIGTILNMVDLSDLRRFGASAELVPYSEKYLRSYRHLN